MSDEQSYVFDEENLESVHKTTISKLFAPIKVTTNKTRITEIQGKSPNPQDVSCT